MLVRYTFAFVFFLSISLSSFSQNVGIGTNLPKARLHVADSSVVFTAGDPYASVTGAPPITGAGARMLWYSGKAAFRAGFVNGTQWDKDSIGYFSIAAGYGTRASNINTAAFGFLTNASAEHSTALGYNTRSSGTASLATGSYSEANGNSSTTFGNSTFASGFTSAAFGFATIARADQSVSFGSYTKSRSPNSLVAGIYNDTTATNRLFEVGNGVADNFRNNAMTVLANGNTGIGTANPKARLHVTDSSVVFTGGDSANSSTTFNPPVSGAGNRMMWYPQKSAFRVGTITGQDWDKNQIGVYSLATGFNTRATAPYSISMGYNNIVNGEAAFGIGFSNNVYGKYAVGMGYSNFVSGESAVAFGNQTQSTGFASLSVGYQSKATGDYSFSGGVGSESTGHNSFTFGNYCRAYTFYSASIGYANQTFGQSALSIGGGTIARGNYSFSSGYSSEARGQVSFATGRSTLTKVDYSAVFGAFNDTSDVQGTTIIPGPTERIFQIGNGDGIVRSNALTVLYNGTTGIGTAKPTKQLEVVGQNLMVTMMIANRAGFGPASMEFISDYGASNQWRPGYIRSNDVGIYTGTLEFYTNGSGVGSLNGSVKGFEIRNGAALTATGAVGSFSDIRLKNTITPFTDGLDVIRKLNPVTYYYNADAPFPTDKKQVGIIAQELESVAPYMVEKNKEKGYDDLRLVNNQAYTFLLINAVKQQQEEIDELKKLVKQLLEVQRVQQVQEVPKVQKLP